MTPTAAMDLPEASGRLMLDEPAERYYQRELGVASNSALKLIRDKTPAHYRAWIDGDDEQETPAMTFGRAYHCRVLEPETFRHRYVLPPSFGDMRSSKNREQRDAWLAHHPAVILLSAEDHERIEAMHAALVSHPVVAGILRTGHSEVTMRWTDYDTGLQCKARADWWVPGKLLMDLKTTDDASPNGFARSVVKYSYHVQHAHYCDGARACDAQVRNYLIVAQEKTPPYLVGVYHIDANAEYRGYELRQRSMKTMRQCLDSNTWPGYGAGITDLHLPEWAMKD